MGFFTVTDTLTQNGVTQIVFDADDKRGDFLLMKDFMGKESVLDRRHYAGVFAAVFAAARQAARPVTLNFTLDGQGWHLKAAPAQGVDTDAAYAAFLAALDLPD